MHPPTALPAAPLRVSVPLTGSCPDCGGYADMRLEAVAEGVFLVHDGSMGCGHRAYAGPVAGLPATAPLALEVALARC